MIQVVEVGTSSLVFNFTLNSYFNLILHQALVVKLLSCSLKYKTKLILKFTKNMALNIAKQKEDQLVCP